MVVRGDECDDPEWGHRGLEDFQRDEDRASRARGVRDAAVAVDVHRRGAERDAALVLPPALRTRELTVRLPRYQIGALETLAEEGREPVEALLMRMIEELADLHHERLERVIPGLGEARVWPEPARPAAAATGRSVGRQSLGRPFESETTFP